MRSSVPAPPLVTVALGAGGVGVEMHLVPGLLGAMGPLALLATNALAALLMGFLTHATLKESVAGQASADT